MVYGGGTIHYRRRDAVTGWGNDVTLTTSAGGHSSVTLVDRGDVLVTWPEYDHNRLVEREVIDGNAGDALAVFDGGEGGLAGARLGIDLNVLAASAGPFRVAFTTSTGANPPFTVWLGSIARARSTSP